MRNNNLYYPIYLFDGVNQHSKNKKIEEIKKTILNEVTEFNFDLLYADDIEPKKVIEIAETLPFASEYRLIILRNFGKYSTKQKNILAEYSNNPVMTTCLILDANERLDKREAWHKIFISNKNKKFVEIETFWEYKYRDFMKIIIDIFNKNDKNIDYEATSVLAELIETNPAALDEEIQKILNFVGEKKTVSLDDIRQNVVKTQNHNLYKWASEVTGQNFSGAIQFLNNLSHNEIKTPQLLFYSLTERFIKISKYLTLLDEGKSSTEAQKSLGIISFLEPTFHKEAISFDFEKLTKIFDLIIKTDFGFKTGQGIASSNIKFLFETLLFDIQSVINEKSEWDYING
ncbi:MAG: DNA polymerase III subunit delta [Elusimicrobiota bacterium]|jgi:DNA polymerase-3 subunit delta|nr:DNA polymerase III subunit delta [Elusimicrobiota bacterium]